MKIFIASEHAGFELKEKLFDYLQSKGHEVEKAGGTSTEPVDYPPIIEEAAVRVVKGEFDLGVFICGTGIGVSIAASKVPGTRTALCTNGYMGAMAREHNNANVICLGSRVIGLDLAFAIIDAFLSTEFQGGRHKRRMSQVASIEEKYFKEVQ